MKVLTDDIVKAGLPMEQAVAFATLAAQIPDVTWIHDDDLCDCTFQRIGEWTNPYIARTLRVRMCCIWNEIYKQYPQFVQEIPAFNDYRVGPTTWNLTPWDWDGESDMPRAMWHRQIASITGMDLSMVREVYAGVEPPRGRYEAIDEVGIREALDC